MVTTSIRLDDDTYAELELISGMRVTSKNNTINYIIHKQFFEISHDPDLTQAFEDYISVRNSLVELNKKPSFIKEGKK